MDHSDFERIKTRSKDEKRKNRHVNDHLMMKWLAPAGVHIIGEYGDGNVVTEFW